MNLLVLVALKLLTFATKVKLATTYLMKKKRREPSDFKLTGSASTRQKIEYEDWKSLKQKLLRKLPQRQARSPLQRNSKPQLRIKKKRRRVPRNHKKRPKWRTILPEKPQNKSRKTVLIKTIKVQLQQKIRRLRGSKEPNYSSS